MFSLLLFHSPPSQSVHGQMRIDMEEHREPEQHGTVHISEACIQELLKDTLEDMTSNLTETFQLRLQSFKKKHYCTRAELVPGKYCKEI